MSTIISANVSDGTLSIPTTFVTNGSAKAWVNFNQIGTQAIRDSFNISSITDVLGGSSSFGVSSSFSNTNAEVTGASTYVDNNWRFSPRTRLSSSSAIEFQTANSAQSLADADQNSFSAHGDLA